ncbi:MAG TPA: SDR family oxidoreductase, partial [Gemmatimonadaceae bacterium]|nr:SDR family oxidoreductase [Gemmatimonadaceae bacterium]
RAQRPRRTSRPARPSPAPAEAELGSRRSKNRAVRERTDLTRVMGDAFRARVRSQVPAGRVADPSEIADAAVFLASDESRCFVGAELVADGGLSQL